jgi:hypothetical protein
MNKSTQFSAEVRERAVRMVQEHRGEYPSLWAAVESMAPKIGCVSQTLLGWVDMPPKFIANGCNRLAEFVNGLDEEFKKNLTNDKNGDASERGQQNLLENSHLTPNYK